jgi:energy-converting hydrogenase Eha subunit B
MASPNPFFGNIDNPYETDYGTTGGLGAFINNIVQMIMTVGGLIFFGLLVYGGIQYLTSGGNEDTVESAQNTITYAVLGLVIIAAAWFIVKILETVLGIQILDPMFTGPMQPNPNP